MAGPRTIEDTDTADKASTDVRVFAFDFDDHLAAGVELATAGTFTLDPEDGRLTKDNEALVSGNRGTQLRLLGGKPGKTYVVKVLVATNETPAQTFTKWFHLFIQAEQ